MAAGHDSVPINVLKSVILPLLPEDPLCWNLVFQYLQNVTGRVVWLAFLVWFVSSQVIPKTEDRLGPQGQVR
ncbi:hypothetical protein PG991_016213 [Apiospora marii]|uniref:Uncharacterized protein n=1 Tax=Apiospora marii TaxID=335849 RepID=A0ABR1R0Z5_9PEZI